MSYGDDHDDPRASGVPAQTRTRLPEQPDATARRPPSSPGRSILAIVGVIVLLLAAIVVANQAGQEDGESGSGSGANSEETGGATGAQPTAPTGERPVEGSTGGIPSGFAQTEQGAQSAAANYAVALGGVEMFNTEQRHTIVDTISAASARDALRTAFDSDYTEALNADIGLTAAGAAPEGHTFVNRTMPIGSSVTSYTDTGAEVAVWCAGLFGVAGLESENPVRASWFTLHLSLTWENGDWKVTGTEQTEGPTPVSGDNVVSGADDIAEAIEEYGGFTYAR